MKVNPPNLVNFPYYMKMLTLLGPIRSFDHADCSAAFRTHLGRTEQGKEEIGQELAPKEWQRIKNPNPNFSGIHQMASSRVIASSSSGKSNLSRQSSSLYPKPAADLQNSSSDGDPPKSIGSMIMEDLIRNIYGDNVPAVGSSPYTGGGGTPAASGKGLGVTTTEEMWREITAGRQAEGAGEVDGLVSESESKDTGEMTLEDFLARAGAVIEEEVRAQSGVFSASDQFGQKPLTIENPVRGFGNGTEVVSIVGGRGRRRPLLDPEDRVTLQRQKRMIKNRESAARSRERKQAYTAELESLVHQLEQENAQLHIELEQGNKERFKQLMEMEVPVTMKSKPPRQIRRTSSG